MDYLDPKKIKRHRLLLFTGYLFIAVAIVMTSLVLVYQAYGFGVTRKGAVIQNGLIFFSSQPSPATIYLNGANKGATNTRLVLPEGVYKAELVRQGYHTWKRTIELNGGSVEHYDYPFLIPTSLANTKKIETFPAPPALMTQSPDRRWLLIRQNSAFSVYDLKSPAKAPVSFTLPAGVVTRPAVNDAWQAGEWADDNQHLVLQHLVDGKVEYILVDRSSPEQSLNLNTLLGTNPAQLNLRDKKYDLYYVYDSAAANLYTAALKEPSPQLLLDHVLGFKAYGKQTVLYATDVKAAAGTVNIRLANGDNTYTIRSLPSGGNYLLDMAGYSGSPYIAAGSSNGNKVYIYKDPIGQIQQHSQQKPVPVQVIHLQQPTALSFSASAQFVAAESGQQFSVYDIENKSGHIFTAGQPIDSPQTRATWMDGNRLMYVSQGKLQIFDYDHANQRGLVVASPAYLPAFSPDYKYLYVLAPNSAGQLELVQTALRTANDL